MGRKIGKVIFAIWVFLWIFFLARGFAKGGLEKYIMFFCSARDEKYSYILGKDLNGFLNLCRDRIPENGTYKIEGTLDEHNRFRLVYYLYPRKENRDPDYLLDIEPGISKYELKRIR